MVVTKVKRKYVVVNVEIDKLHRFLPIEVRLMSNVRRITGILVTVSENESVQRLGTVVFQASDESDVFLMMEVRSQGIDMNDLALSGIDEGDFESNCAWATGHVPTIKRVNVAGDNVFLKAWFKGETFSSAYILRIYIECELSEELTGVVTERLFDADEKRDLEPVEINL